MRSHKNYGIYKQIKQDIRDGRLMLHDKIYVCRSDEYLIYYELIKTDGLETMIVEEVLQFISKNG